MEETSQIGSILLSRIPQRLGDNWSVPVNELEHLSVYIKRGPYVCLSVCLSRHEHLNLCTTKLGQQTLWGRLRAEIEVQRRICCISHRGPTSYESKSATPRLARVASYLRWQKGRRHGREKSCHEMDRKPVIHTTSPRKLLWILTKNHAIWQPFTGVSEWEKKCGWDGGQPVSKVKTTGVWIAWTTRSAWTARSSWTARSASTCRAIESVCVDGKFGDDPARNGRRKQADTHSPS